MKMTTEDIRMLQIWEYALEIIGDPGEEKWSIRTEIKIKNKSE